MTALTDTLRRAAAFLDALPDDLPEPMLSVDENRTLWMEWARGETKRDRTKHFVVVSTVEPDELLWVTSGDPRMDAFDGVTVPPKVLAAIRKVIV